MHDFVLIENFLRRHHMHHETIDINALIDDFIADMKEGLAGHPQSLLMIPTYMEMGRDVPSDEPIIVIDAGGTNFRVALVTFGANKAPTIEHFAKHPMPGSQGAIPKKAFFDAIIDYLLPLLSKSSKIGFCFSFPTVILPNRDGRLLAFDKEVRVDDSPGMLLGEELNARLLSRGHSTKHITVLNDTVAAMFAGLAGKPGKEYDGFMGLILGTGMNTCYFEQKRNIKGMQGNGLMAINMESGGFSGAPQGTFDIQLDLWSDRPGAQALEKMISGAYLGELMRSVIWGAVREELLGRQFLTSFSAPGLSTRDINAFMEAPFGQSPLACACKSDVERWRLYCLIEACLERSAKFMAVVIGGILAKTGQGKDITRPVCILAEGTVFHHFHALRQKIDYHLMHHIQRQRGQFFDIVRIEDATLIGTAIAGLMN